MKVLTEFYPLCLIGLLVWSSGEQCLAGCRDDEGIYRGRHLPLPERVREKRTSSLGKLLEEMPEISSLIDVTEQERRAFYSGRRKRHTLKTQVVGGKEEGLIMDVSLG